MIAFPISDELAAATRSYLQAFGHPVPNEVVERFARRPGPLLLEVRQALRQQSPVKSWLAQSRRSPLAREQDSERDR
jgi:hypothetical protein